MTKKQALSKIVKARAAAGISQHTAAKAAGISQPAWHYTETGKTCPTWDTLFKMAAGVGLELSVAITGRA